MKIGDEIYIRANVNEIRKDYIICENAGGYFGTVREEIRQIIPKSVIDDIRAEILNWEDEPECDDDLYQIGAKDMQKYVLAIIDKHIKVVKE